MVNIFGDLDIRCLAGENDETGTVDTIIRLHDESIISGFQLRIGSEQTNGKKAHELIGKVENLGIPFVVHGPFESHGVDLGESYDPNRVFHQFRRETGNRDWSEFNKDAINGAYFISTSENNIGNYMLLHPGCSKNTVEARKKGFEQIKRNLYDLQNGRVISLETIPSLKFDEQMKIHHYAFGGTPSEMSAFVRNGGLYDTKVLLDFSHLSVQANQMASHGDMFDRAMTFEELVGFFLGCGLDINPYCHFSGHYDGALDVHPGFLAEAATEEKVRTTREAFEHMGKRSRDFSIILELPFRDYESARREIDELSQKYL